MHSVSRPRLAASHRWNPPAPVKRRRTISVVATQAGTQFVIPKRVAGQMMYTLNQRALSKTHPNYQSVKTATNQAAIAVWGSLGKVQVRPQGSTAKGTSIPSSDYDFFITMPDNPLTRKERRRFRDEVLRQLQAAELTYNAHLGENRIFLFDGKGGGQVLPDVDIVFERFGSDVRSPPNSRVMARTHVGQQVVKCIKLMPHTYKNLHEPSSSRLEEFVLLVHDELQGPRGQQLVGAEGFGVLLGVCLAKMSRQVAINSTQEGCLVQAHMRGVDDHWGRAAKHALPRLVAGTLQL